MEEINDRDDTIDMIVEKYGYCEFEEFGRGPAFDCWGFVREVYRQEKGIVLPSLIDEYDNCNDRRKLPGLFDQEIDKSWVRVTEPSLLDCAAFEMLGVRMHVGLMLNKTMFMHIEEDAGVVVEDLSDPDCGRVLEGVYRHVRDG